jgi:hypothetical protein
MVEKTIGVKPSKRAGYLKSVQTRFHVFDLAGPQSDEIETLLSRFLDNQAAA